MVKLIYFCPDEQLHVPDRRVLAEDHAGAGKGLSVQVSAYVKPDSVQSFCRDRLAAEFLFCLLSARLREQESD